MNRKKMAFSCIGHKMLAVSLLSIEVWLQNVDHTLLFFDSVELLVQACHFDAGL